MVLAAGYGTRLRPLSLKLPKPMFPVVNRPLVDFALERLVNLDIGDVAVNLHYLPDPIRNHLEKGSRFGQQITFSEEPKILGTGGGIKAIREWISNETFCVTNGDTIFLGDLSPVLETHRKKGALATLALLPTLEIGRFGAVTLDHQDNITDIAGHVTKNPEGRTGIFVGFHILESELFNHMPNRDRFCIVNDVYIPLIKEKPGSVAGAFVSGEFFDMGTPEDYLIGNMTLLSKYLNASSAFVEGCRHLGDNVFVGDRVHLGRGVNLIGPCLIANDARIEGGSEIGKGTVVGDGAYLGAWTRLYGCIAWPKALLPGGGLNKHSIIYGRKIHKIESYSP